MDGGFCKCKKMVRKTRLKNLFRWVFILCSIGSLYFVPWIIVKAWLMPLPETVQDQVDNVINYGFDGIIVFVQKNGKDPQYYASGFHNKEKRIPADPHALFKIASITKLYEAVCVTKLISEGKLSETNVLSELLPELKGRIQYADKITLKNLVQHRSGIPNFTDTYNYWSAPKETEEECLALILDKPANFKPGEDYEYSNTNYILISRIMDRVLGYNYFEYLREKILIPKGLKDTFESIDKIDINRLMSGYYVGYDHDLKFEKVGTIIASAEDV
ncbi:MAG: hypothetical protein RIR51_190, partial [Bacteroidota bacterium]